MMAAVDFKVGDWVVYQKQKTSTSPGPRAQGTIPSSKGETYSYVVEKHWVVTEVLNGELRLVTRRGKEHIVSVDDRLLRKAAWRERLLNRKRYRAVEETIRGKVETRQANL